MDGLVSQLEEDPVLGWRRPEVPKHVFLAFSRRCCGICRGRAGADAEPETEAATVESGHTVANQYRVALVKAHPHVDVAQCY